MPVYEDCRHYLRRSTSAGDVLQRCRLSANADDPFACPQACLFHESAALSRAGWAQAPAEPMDNTADGLDRLPPAKPKKPRKRR